jgi:lysophospholipid acyltransferase (LPLAT)-like uncharacterized protein
LLAKKSGFPILPFNVTAQRFWATKSWDRLQVPVPFSSALVSIAPPIYVAKDANEAELNEKRDELQRALDQLVERGERWRRL